MAAGGSGGMATGGAGGSTVGACNFPTCISDLQTACVPTGTCMSQIGIGGANLCWANGVKSLTSIAISGTSAVATTRWTKMDGSTCYTTETPVGASGVVTLTYKNAAGTVVATGMTNAGGNTFTVTCTGQTPVTVNLQTCGAQGGMTGTGGAGGSGGCTMGMCP
jgi:hypothetical protein